VNLVRHDDPDAFTQGVGFMTAWGITYPLTRKLGLILSDPLPLAGVVPIRDVYAGKHDSAEIGTTQYERFFNSQTVTNAGDRLYHNPDDGRYVPTELPPPRPVTMEMLGVPDGFP